MSDAAAGRESAVRVDVLGPLQLVVNGAPVPVPGPKRRAVLALLAMAEGSAVSVDDLIDALWPSDVPDAARASLQSHVSRLRAHLGGAARRLEGLPGAYRLVLDDGDEASDEARARALLAAASAATNPSDARRVLSEARALWRGPPLSELSEVAPLAAWAVRLEELRRAVEHAYAEATLGAGEAAEAAGLAAALVTADPLSEPPVLVLMRALHATGRSAEALRAAHDHRRRLASETGLEPSPDLGELEREIAGHGVSPSGGVPRPDGRLRGRDSELAALHRLLAHERLVTILGPGGIGKTRLAVELASRNEPARALLLAPVGDPAAIPHALASALDLQVVQGDVLAACAALLAAGPQLLVIDNCEHLLPDVADVTRSLLDACPLLTVLATSREPLGLESEQRFRVAPLPVTAPHDLDDLGRSPAVAVFVDRARRVRPDFAPDGQGLHLVAEIVRRLDGVPFAVELAAGRLSSLDLVDLHDRLDRSLDLLGDGRRVTLRQTIQWSYNLLPEHEQRLFRHLGAFPDGFDLAAVEHIAGDLALPVDAAGALAHLVDASMVDAHLGPAPRYRMLDTIRSFAGDALDGCDERETATDGFLRWALDLVRWLDLTIDSFDEPRADRVVRSEVGNLRAAFLLTRRLGRFDDSAAIVLGLGEVVGWRDLTEMSGWALELADDPACGSHAEAGALLGLAAAAAWERSDLDRAVHHARRGLQLAGGSAWRCHAALALVALDRGDLSAAAVHAGETTHQASRVDQSLGVAALALAYGGDLPAARDHNERLGQAATSPTLEAFHHYVGGEIDALAGETDRAEERYERAISLSRASGATFVDGVASVGLLTVRVNAGRVAEALDGYRELIDYWDRTSGWARQWTTLRNLADLLRTLDDEETAAFLDAAADHAPDASPLTPAGAGQERGATGSAAMAAIREAAASASRSVVLERAREAIARHRAAVGPAVGSSR